ncbi:MAG: endonuclease/exonuclease/phosphatase family protein [Pseudonocardiaceae bacterium]
MQVLTWNVQHANAARTHQQAVWLATSDLADVLVLTEVAAGRSGQSLARWLEDFGYTVYLPDPGEDDRYRVLLACRTGVLDPVDVGIKVLPHRCIAARIKLPDTQLAIVGLYVPSRGPQEKRNVAKRAFQDAVAAALAEFAGRLDATGPVVITGDLNVVEPDHDPHYSVFGTWEYDFYCAFEENGFADAFRIRQPHGMDYSWFGRPSAEGKRNGYRFDHTFVTAAHSGGIRDCRYLHAIRQSGLSDHSAMTLTLAL